MPERMAEVELGAPAALALVGGDDLRLDLAGALHGVRQRVRILREQRVEMTLEPVEKRRIGDERVLDDLGEPGAELAGRQRRQRRGVGDHRDRLVKGADQVLAGGMVHAGLAADRGVDLREQRGRQLDEIDTALVAGGGEPGHVADHAPAERGDARVAVEARLDHGVEDAGHGSERLVRLSIGKSERLHALARRGPSARARDTAGPRSRW